MKKTLIVLLLNRHSAEKHKVPTAVSINQAGE